MRQVFVRSAVAASLCSLVLAGPVLAETKNGASRSVDLVCMQNAVEKRDSSVATAWDVHAAAIKGGLSARKTALKAAWGLTERKARREALRTAWRTWRETARTAVRTWRKAKGDAWHGFQKARKECGPGAAADDVGSSGSDAEI
jgi:hypothetical protein